MNFDKDKVCRTTHWADTIFKPLQKSKNEVFGIDNHRPVLLYVGRVSKEKGVLELPAIHKAIKKNHPDVALVVVGQGPDYEELKAALPEVICFDWVEREKLPEIYSAADLLVFPSKFDTFSCVVLESLTCGLPVIAYNTKGPKDIIEDGICGYLVNSNEQISNKINTYLKGDKKLHDSFRQAAVARSKNYDINKIMQNFIADIDLQ
jgi:glycosyltransferase involved in cell wall biosynthesis